MGKRHQRISDLIGLINRLYPPSLAENWDPVGLQVGDPAVVLERVLVALDPTVEALRMARKSEAQVLLTHHPLFFKPLQRLTPVEAVGQIAWTAIEQGVAILSVHTNLDSAASGLNDWLASRLCLEDGRPLQAAPGDFLKLVVFVPVTHEEVVAEALFSGGAGHIGAYDRCSFRTTGTGTFRGSEDTQPFLGQAGKTEEAEEIRLETIVDRAQLARVLQKMRQAHPYEEVAYDLIPLQNQIPGAGLGRIGDLASGVTLESFLGRIKAALGCQHLRVVGEPDREVKTVAVCGGSGSHLLAAAKHQGADLLVTGDVKYHEARQAEDLGIALVDAGHFATEQIMVPHIVQMLSQASKELGWEVAFEAYTGEKDPFRFF